jgi:hypothetical protein
MALAPKNFPGYYLGTMWILLIPGILTFIWSLKPRAEIDWSAQTVTYIWPLWKPLMALMMTVPYFLFKYCA